jgi:hypothetical protein
MPRGVRCKNKYYRAAQDFPDCPHLHFFKCKTARECLGCYYNPRRIEALQHKPGYEDDPPKESKEHWFYHYKRHSKKMLAMLDDIKNGVGLFPNGHRYYLRHARRNGENND